MLKISKNLLYLAKITNYTQKKAVKVIKLVKAKPSDIGAMQALVAPQVEAGIILARSNDEVATNIRSYILAKDENEELLGFGALHIVAPDLAEVRSLIVAPNIQKTGLGSKIVNELIKEARELGLGRVFALTYAQGFFESLGFKMIEKSELPAQKIWSDCIKCKHFPICDEKALMLYL